MSKPGEAQFIDCSDSISGLTPVSTSRHSPHRRGLLELMKSLPDFKGEVSLYTQSAETIEAPYKKLTREAANR